LVHSGGQILKLPIGFKSAGKDKMKIKEKREFYEKSVFDKIDFGFRCNVKKLW